MLDIATFDPARGGNVLYKALAHPLTAEPMAALKRTLAEGGPFAVYDPAGAAESVWMLNPDMPAPSAVYVQDVQQVGQRRLGCETRPVTELAGTAVATVLVAAFDADRLLAQADHLMPPAAKRLTLDAARIPAALHTNPRRYLDRQNFATNFVFFRDAGGLSTRLVTANYWVGYGAKEIRLWCRLFDADGTPLATWDEPVAQGAGGIAIDSREVRARFGLGEFTGQLFIHVIGAAGHDTVKYALDTFATDGGPTLSCTHDANAWPSDRYAGLPAPNPGETVILWLQNSHPSPIPAGTIAFDRMGAEQPVPLAQDVPGFASVAVDVAALLPGLHWPAQIEMRAGRHVVRPRYEVTEGARTRIAHVNVERDNLRPDPGIPGLGNALGRGYLLPFPVLPRSRYRSILQPNPMAITQTDLPLRLEVFDRAGQKVFEKFLGCLPRNHDLAIDLDEVLETGALADGGHGELIYDFRDGGGADGWLHGLFRYIDRTSGHAAETSFGAHVFNTIMTYRDEPQSYSGPPPGLSTRLFLRLGYEGRRSFAHLIYPASAPWHARSHTRLVLHDSDGAEIAEAPIAIACSGSFTVRPHEHFSPAQLTQAGERGYVLIRDTTCRLFGYHGLEDARGGFALDHMFGF